MEKMSRLFSPHSDRHIKCLRNSIDGIMKQFGRKMINKNEYEKDSRA